MKVKYEAKLYEVTTGTIEKNEEAPNFKRYTVIAHHAENAIDRVKVGGNLIDEKGVVEFIESVVLVSQIDIL